MIRLIVTFLAIAITSLSARAQESDRVWETRIVRAAISGERLWIARVNGALESYDLDGGDLQVVGQGISIITASADHVWVTPTSSAESGLYELSDARSDATLPPLQMTDGERLIEVVLGGQTPIAVSTRNLYFLDAGAWRVQPLLSEIRPGYSADAVIQGDGEAMFVGFANGEWGGALHRIDLSSGEVNFIERVDRDGLCEGPLNPSCDPVTALLPDPEHLDCVLAAIGLQHLGMQVGRLLRVCGTEVSVILERRTTIPMIGRAIVVTTPIYGLVRGDDSLWLLTHESALRLRGNRVVETIRFNFNGDSALRVQRPNDEIILLTGLPETRHTVRGPNGRSFEMVTSQQQPLMLASP